MKKKELEHLLRQPESGSLDFKREMHHVFHEKDNVRNWQQNELVRDVLSLANGNTHTVGESAYLIIGIEENEQDPTQHRLHPVSTFELSAKQILDWVNAYADPPLEDLQAEFVTYNETQLYIITIFPSVHVHRLKRDLQTGKTKNYPENSIFIRINDQIRNASVTQAQALGKAKKQAAAVSRYIHPVWGLGIVVAILFGSMDWLNISAESENTQNLIGALGRENAGWLLRGVMALLFGLLAAGLGNAYMQVQDIRLWFIKATNRQRLILIGCVMAFILGALLFKA